jgi:hypothetical protein
MFSYLFLLVLCICCRDDEAYFFWIFLVSSIVVDGVGWATNLYYN